MSSVLSSSIFDRPGAGRPVAPWVKISDHGRATRDYRRGGIIYLIRNESKKSCKSTENNAKIESGGQNANRKPLFCLADWAAKCENTNF